MAIEEAVGTVVMKALSKGDPLAGMMVGELVVSSAGEKVVEMVDELVVSSVVELVVWKGYQWVVLMAARTGMTTILLSLNNEEA